MLGRKVSLSLFNPSASEPTSTLMVERRLIVICTSLPVGSVPTAVANDEASACILRPDVASGDNSTLTVAVNARGAYGGGAIGRQG